MKKKKEEESNIDRLRRTISMSLVTYEVMGVTTEGRELWKSKGEEYRIKAKEENGKRGYQSQGSHRGWYEAKAPSLSSHSRLLQEGDGTSVRRKAGARRGRGEKQL